MHRTQGQRSFCKARFRVPNSAKIANARLWHTGFVRIVYPGLNPGAIDIKPFQGLVQSPNPIIH